MTTSRLATAFVGLLLLSGAPQSAEPTGAVPLGLEPAINGRVSPSGYFPTRAMEEEFTNYLAWVGAQGLSPLVAFESLIREEPVGLASRRMEEQFEAYLRWVDHEGLSPFYAFGAQRRP